jgi:hypothetical protein
MAFEWFMSPAHLPLGTTSPFWAVGDGALAGVYGSGLSIADQDGRRSLRGDTSSGYIFAVPGLSEFRMGGRWRHQIRDQTLIGFRNVANSELLNVYLTSAGGLNVRRDTTVLASYAGPLSTGVWYYMEVHVVFHGSAGSVTMKIDGVEVLSATGLDTLAVAGPCEFVRLHGGNFGFWADLYANDRGAFLGPLEFRRLDPTSDIATAWAPDSGTANFSRVAGVAATSSYVESNTVDDTDEYGVENVPVGVNSIIAVVRYSVSEAPEGGAPQIAQGLKRGATEKYVTDPERTVGVGGPRTQLTPHLTQPNGSPWSVAAADEINSLLKAV